MTAAGRYAKCRRHFCSSKAGRLGDGQNRCRITSSASPPTNHPAKRPTDHVGYGNAPRDSPVRTSALPQISRARRGVGVFDGSGKRPSQGTALARTAARGEQMRNLGGRLGNFVSLQGILVAVTAALVVSSTASADPVRVVRTGVVDAHEVDNTFVLSGAGFRVSAVAFS